MRHRHSGRQLSRVAPHRHAMLRNMAASLLRHETIRTTVPKAKELRRVVEPLITLGKVDTEAKRRIAFSKDSSSLTWTRGTNIHPLLTESRSIHDFTRAGRGCQRNPLFPVT